MIRAECAGRVGSVFELLQGRLSDHVRRVVTDPDRGLFPKPGKITLTCDCPDWAVMCKHAAPCSTASAAGSTSVPSCSSACGTSTPKTWSSATMALPDAAAGDDVLAGDLPVEGAHGEAAKRICCFGRG